MISRNDFWPYPLTWEAPENPGLIPRVATVLDSWRRTSYSERIAEKGRGANCATFVAGALAELEHKTLPDIGMLDVRLAFHSKRKGRAALRRFREAFADFDDITGTHTVQPGDVLVIGHLKKGPGHCLLVGYRRNTVWECAHGQVCQTGWVLPNTWMVYHIYRKKGRGQAWLNN